MYAILSHKLLNELGLERGELTESNSLMQKNILSVYNNVADQTEPVIIAVQLMQS